MTLFQRGADNTHHYSPCGFSGPSHGPANVTYMMGSGLMGHELSRLCHSYFYHRQFFSINVDKLSRKEVNLVLQFMQLQLSKGLEPSCCKKRQKNVQGKKLVWGIGDV